MTKPVQPSPPTEAVTPAAAPRQRRPPRRVEVTRVQVLSPAMRRVTLQGAELAGFAVSHPASYMKLIFPEPGQTEPARPLPDGPRSANMRTYTPLAVRADALEVDVDFVLHGHGPAATWAAQARAGQVLFLMGPGPGYPLDTQAAQHLLLGDASALPAFETILACLPATARVRVLVEVVAAAEQRTLQSLAQLDIAWLTSEPGHDAGHALEAAVRLAGRPALDEYIYLACEASAVRRIRRLLMEELGVARERIVARGYWKRGSVNHPDHDYGEDA